MSENSKAIVKKPMEKIQGYLESEVIKNRFATVLGEQGSASYISSVLLAVANKPELQVCTPSSIYVSALRAATMRLSVDESTGQAYLVPFKEKATLIIGWKGIYDMAIRTGKYRRIEVHKLYEGETFEQDRLTGMMSLGGSKKSNKTGGWMAIFEMYPPKGQRSGMSAALFMTVDEIHAHAQKYSRGYDRKDGAWKTATEQMEKKTVLRLLLRTRGYLDPQDEAAMAEIEEETNGQDLPDGNNDFSLPEDVIEVEATTPTLDQVDAAFPPMTKEEAAADLEKEQKKAAAKEQKSMEQLGY